MNFVLNVDMMYRLPGQNIEELLYDVENITSLGIDHITWFPYMPVPDTRVYKEIKKGKLPERPDLKEYFHMYRTLIERMNKKGYKEYTPYHFSLPDKECVYNKDRWGIPQQETVGIGAGAFSFFNNWIYANAHNVEDYLKLLNDKKYPALIGKKLTPEEKISRLAVLGIKLLSISKKEFKKHSGIEIETFYKNELKEIENLHLVKINEESIDCTLLGKAFNNDISKRFFVGSSRGKKQPLPINLKKVRI
jgi:oxygen-independent coproporphyrinogen-3 oxidase